MRFLSNLLAMVVAGVLTFSALGYATEALEQQARTRRRHYVVLWSLIDLVAVPLAANTVVSYLVDYWTTRVDHAAKVWLQDTLGATVTQVEFGSTTAHVYVRYNGTLPATSGLMHQVAGQVPDGIKVVLDTSVGTEVVAGTVGQD